MGRVRRYFRAHGMALTRTRRDPDRASLIARLKRGERKAQGEFFDAYVGMVERVLFRLLGPDVELSDMVQDVFIQALRSVRSFRGDEGGLESWLRSVAIRTALKRVRWRKARSWLGHASPDAVLELSATSDPVTQTALARAFEVLDRLPSGERAVFVLRFVEGMQLQEVAQACAISLATVKRRIDRARSRFQRWAQQDALLAEWMRARLGDES